MKEYRDKFWVVNQIRKELLNEDTELHDMFDWLLRVWNTNKDFEYPSLEEYNPDEEEEE